MSYLPIERGSLAPAITGPGAHAPPRVSFELLAKGQAPLVYLPEGARERPAVTMALRSMLTRPPGQGLVSPDAWEDLLAAAGLSANVFVVDRRGERWRVLEVEFDPGGETGQLRVRHLGPLARAGDRLIDLQEAFGYMIPVVVYKGPPGPSGLRTNPSLLGTVFGWAAVGAVSETVRPLTDWAEGKIVDAGKWALGQQKNPPVPTREQIDARPWLSLKAVRDWVPLADELGVSSVAREGGSLATGEGFLQAYAACKSSVLCMRRRRATTNQTWAQRRAGFVQRHLAQARAGREPLWQWDEEREAWTPSRRNLALIMWAYWAEDPPGGRPNPCLPCLF